MVDTNILLPQHLNEEVCMYLRRLRGVSVGCMCVRVCVCVCVCNDICLCNWCKTPFEVRGLAGISTGIIMGSH